MCFPAYLSFERAAAHKVRGFDFIDYACLWNVRITGTWHVVKVVAFDLLGYLHPAKVLGRENLNRSPEQGGIARTRACVLNLQGDSPEQWHFFCKKGCSPNELLQEGTRTVAGRKSKIATGFPKREELPQTGAFFSDDFVKICFCGPDLQEGMEEGREEGREGGRKGAGKEGKGGFHKITKHNHKPSDQVTKRTPILSC